MQLKVVPLYIRHIFTISVNQFVWSIIETYFIPSYALNYAVLNNIPVQTILEKLH